MSDTTANLSLPYILPSQAQKHVTHNEGLQVLDVLVQLTVTATLTAPPSDPSDGACFAIAPSATGLWSGKDGKLAFHQDGFWVFLQPKEGWRAWFLADDRLYIHDGSVWNVFDPIGTPPFFGINATADETNRLALSSHASLFNNAGNGHQIKVNKAAASDTASLLFQTGWSGRAEMGLAGSDAFTIKTSPDGSVWTNALSISGSGIVIMPHRPLVRATLGGGVGTPANNSQTGFNTTPVSQGGFTLGSTVPGDNGKRLVVPSSGPYLIVLRVEATPSGAFSVTARANGTTGLATATGSGTVIGMAFLQENDWISLSHTGSTPIDFATGKTELSLLML
ncbi:DUF2793 domain-containing protein [Pararhizobium sp.]|uniref:DUF2793 domain-containing protein n=1 Tax=Pararhizobium sp. TaxID=1977563 RepID=UPI00271CEE8C|nr:DUF2793 domain-containing protein [Pararhizobium sp.]MDO9415039.1 DUF2793 domain-containing protein [Pararhizobium sp.]